MRGRALVLGWEEAGVRVAGGGGGARMSVEKRKRKKHGQASDGDRGGDVRGGGLRWGTETRNAQTAG